MLGADLSSEQRAVLRVMLGFHTWRSLVREAGLEQGGAVDLAVRAIEGAGGGSAGTAAETATRP